jgi:hypothetical protein
VDYAALGSLPQEKVAEIRARGCVVIRDVVDDAEAAGWREELHEFVRANPAVEGARALPWASRSCLTRPAQASPRKTSSSSSSSLSSPIAPPRRTDAAPAGRARK